MEVSRAMTWRAEPLPPETVAVVRDRSAELVARIIAAVAADNPVYGQVLGAPEGIGIRLGIEGAIKAFLDAVQRGEHPADETAEMWRLLGEAEFQAGRSLDALRSAFRTGTRAAWRAAAELAAAAGVEAPQVIALAEGIFLYTDELAADVVEGYLRMARDEAGERERRRRRLVALLVDPEGGDPEAVEHAAALAAWPLPERIAAVVVRDGRPGAVARRTDADVLVGGDFLIVPARAAGLERALAAEGAVAAIGPSVGWREVERSLRWARLALELVARGVLAAEPAVRVGEELSTLIVHADPELADALVRRRLEPLLELSSATERDRLLSTLRAWLDHQRHTPDIAAALHVHPQTVRYRVARLRELLGEALESPSGRFELALALRAGAPARG